MNGQTFRESVEEFVATLDDVIVGALDTAERFDTGISRSGDQAIIQLVPGDRRDSPGLALVRSCDNGSPPALFLRAKFTVEMDDEHSYLRVVSSTFGLWVDVTGGHQHPRPIVRVEYDRSQLRPGRAAAHVHLHANSPELAWIYGTSARAAPDLHALHFPAGGQRFRPTLEEFLFFLDRENLFTDWKDGWKSRLIESFNEWEQRQARATVRRYPEEAASTLEALGYAVTAPASAERHGS